MPSFDRDWKGGPDQPEDDEFDSGKTRPVTKSRVPFVDLRPEPRVIPIFPLTSAVLFPRCSMSIHVFEERYKTLIADVLSQDQAVAIALSEEEDPDTNPRDVLTVALVTEVEDLDDGEKDIVVTGSHRARTVEVIETRPYLVGRIVPLEEQPLDDRSLRDHALEVRKLALDWVFFQDSEDAQELIQRISLVDRPSYLADFLAYYLFEDAALKQEILETLDISRRLGRVQTLIAAALDRTKSEKKR